MPIAHKLGMVEEIYELGDIDQLQHDIRSNSDGIFHTAKNIYKL